MKRSILLTIVLSLIITVGCNEAMFGSKNPRSSGNSGPPEANEGGGTPDQGFEPGTGSDLPRNGEVGDGEDQCPTEDQYILILDFKSGWWSGDGGDHFEDILSGMSQPGCSNVAFKVEYHHIIKHDSFCHTEASDEKCENPIYFQEEPFMSTAKLYPDKTDWQFEATFGSSNINDILNLDHKFTKENFADYTQIWLLSGSSTDELDILTSHSFFTTIVSKIVAAKRPMFIGAGFSSIAHANSLSSGLQLGVSFTVGKTYETNQNIIELKALQYNGSNYQNTIVATSEISSLPSHGLFANVSKLADNMKYTEYVKDVDTKTPKIHDTPRIIAVKGDKISGGTEQVKDNAGNTTIATATASGDLKVVVDAGLQRFYVKDTSTAQYIKNIVKYLGN